MSLIQRVKGKVRRIVFSWFSETMREVLSEHAFDLQTEIQRRALRTTADYIIQNIPLDKVAPDRTALMERCLRQIMPEGLILEFGVYRGLSINHIGRTVQGRKVFGFDSFEGLPEPWQYQPKGLFSDVRGTMPSVPANVTLFKGWFQDSLPGFLETHPGPVALLHIDSDLYSSCRYVLECVNDRIVKGTVVVFDEFYNYPGWEQGEHLALQEWCEATGVGYEYLGFVAQRSPNWQRDGSTGEQLAVRITTEPRNPFGSAKAFPDEARAAVH